MYSPLLAQGAGVKNESPDIFVSILEFVVSYLWTFNLN